METCRKCAVSCNMLQGKCRGNGRKDSKILHQSYILHLILHPILHPELPANTEDLGHWCRKCRRFSKNFFYGGEYAYAPTYCRQRSPTQNGTGTSAGDLCAKTLKTHRGRTKFRVVFVDYTERGGRRRSQLTEQREERPACLGYPESRWKKAKPTDGAARGETCLLGLSRVATEEGEAINYSFAMISEGLVRIVLRMFHSTMAAISTMTMSEPPMQEMRGETAPT